MSGNEPHEITVSQMDLYSMIHGLLNYAFGRMSYIVGIAAELTQKYWKDLTPDMRRTITRNLESDVDVYVRTDRKIGMEFDHQVWVNLLAWCKANP